MNELPSCKLSHIPRRFTMPMLALAAVCLAGTWFGQATAEVAPPGQPVTLLEVKQLAKRQRAELVVAAAKVRAAQARITSASALEDPMVMSSIDHYPFKSMGAEDAMGSDDPMGPEPPQNRNGRFDWSVSVEQRFPLSRERRHRRRAAEATARQQLADSERVALDIEFEAVSAFWMLLELRRMLDVTLEQIKLAEQLVKAAAARFGSATGGQSEVLRAEVELARLQANARALAAQAPGLESMLNAAIGQAPQAPVPELVAPTWPVSPPAVPALLDWARAHRPELRVGQAEIARSAAEVDVMRSMYKPMALVRLGSASTMAEGEGAMVMVGVSVPLWRSKLRAGVAEAHAMEDMAEADLVAMRQMVESDTIAAHSAVAAAQARVEALTREVLPRAEMALTPALASYSAGVGTLTAVIDTAQTQWSVQAELVMATSELGLAWARLERAVGRSLEK